LLNNLKKIMNLKDIKKLLGSAIYTRALNYYHNGNVGNIKKGVRFIEAKILGSNDNIYDVTIRIDGDGNPYSYFCDCPYGKICKHIGAVLISEFGEDDFEKSEEKSSNKLKKINEIKKDKILSLDISDGKLSSKITDILSENNTDYHADTLVFEIYKEYSKSYGGDRYQLRPSLFSNKNDIQTLSIFSNETQFKKIDSKSSNLFQLLKLKKDISFLSDYMPLLVDTDFLLYHEVGSKLYEVEMLEITKITVDFEFFSLFNEEPQFIPIFNFQLEDGSIATLKKIHNGIEINGVSILYLHTKGKLYYSLYDGNLAALFLVFKENVSFNYKEIIYLENYLLKRLVDKVYFNFDYKKVKLLYPTPFAIVELQWIFQRLKVSVLFNYNGSEFAFDKKEGYLKLDSLNDEILNVAVKNRVFESEIFNYLEMLFARYMDFSKQGNLKDKRDGVHFVLKLRVEEFLVKFGSELLEYGIVIRTDDRNTEIENRKSSIKFEVETSNDWLEVNSFYENSKGELLNLQLDNDLFENRVVKVGDGYTILTQDEKQKLEEILKLSKKDSFNIKLKKLHYSIIDKLYDDFVKNSKKNVKNLKKIFENLNDYTIINNYDLPNSFNGNLRDYQIAGYNWLHFLRLNGVNGILADDMGLGKTIQTLALLQKVKEEEKKLSVLLVVPLTTMFNWQVEIEKFTPNLTYNRHAGAKRDKDENKLFESDIVLVSYQTLRIDIEYFKVLNYDYIILDEAQYIKNPNSQLYKAIKLLNSKHKLSLTGTPVENGTIELWSQMDFEIKKNNISIYSKKEKRRCS